MRKSKEEKIREDIIEEVFSLFKKSLELIGVESLTTLLEAYFEKDIEYEEVIERFEDFNKQFDLPDFLKGRGQRVRNESIKLGESYYSVTGIVSLGKDSYYNSEEMEFKYQIILNPTTSEIIKLLYSNISIMEFSSEEERNLEMNYLIDKLNLIGIRHINIK